jgi:hypothetical protein
MVGRWRGGPRPGIAAEWSDPVLVHRSGGVVDRERPKRPRLASASSRIAADPLDQQQLARAEASAADHLGGVNGGAGLGCDGHQFAVTAKAAGRSPLRSTSAPTR